MQAPTLESLNKRLRKLEDIEEIRNLRLRYTNFVNDGEFDRFGELYTEDAVVDFGYISGGEARGIEAVRAFFLKIPRNADFVKHLIHNHMVDVKGDEASGVSHIEARYAKDGDSILATGCYREKYRRLPSGWKISETRLTLYFMVPVIPKVGPAKGWAGAELNNFVKPFS